MRIAVIDLGTNTFHLLIAENGKGKELDILFGENIPVKLGEGGINNKFIKEKAFKRGLNAILKFGDKIREFQVEKVTAIGTSALRNAANGKLFCKEVQELTGISIDVIDGDREAELIYKGVRAAVQLQSDNSLIVDIGGGSVEFIICNNKGIFWKRSFEIGAARLLERFHKSDPISTTEMIAVETYLEYCLSPLWEACKNYPTKHLIGSAGSFETFAAIASFLHPENNKTTSNQSSCNIPLPYFYEIHQNLLNSTLAERLKMPGMVEMRADMIVVAVILSHYLINKLSLSEITLSNYALKEGVLAEMVSQK